MISLSLVDPLVPATEEISTGSTPIDTIVSLVVTDRISSPDPFNVFPKFWFMFSLHLVIFDWFCSFDDTSPMSLEVRTSLMQNILGWGHVGVDGVGGGGRGCVSVSHTLHCDLCKAHWGGDMLGWIKGDLGLIKKKKKLNKKLNIVQNCE